MLLFIITPSSIVDIKSNTSCFPEDPQDKTVSTMKSSIISIPTSPFWTEPHQVSVGGSMNIYSFILYIICYKQT